MGASNNTFMNQDAPPVWTYSYGSNSICSRRLQYDSGTISSDTWVGHTQAYSWFRASIWVLEVNRVLIHWVWLPGYAHEIQKSKKFHQMMGWTLIFRLLDEQSVESEWVAARSNQTALRKLLRIQLICLCLHHSRSLSQEVELILIFRLGEVLSEAVGVGGCHTNTFSAHSVSTASI
jgi:hypothetical protein